MGKFWGKLGGAITGPFLFSAMFFLLIPPAFCHAQTPTWYAGQTASFSFQGVFPPTFNLAEESLLSANGDPVP